MNTRNIVLTGLPGAGKTSLGLRLADRLGKPFIDIDAAVEEFAGKSIPEIFTDDGEESFRRMEKEVVRRCARFRDTVIATGGGTILDPENIDILKGDGLLFFLDVAPRSILRRTPLADRPLVCDDIRKLDLLHRQRRRIYLKTADAVIPNGHGRLRKALLRTINAYRRLEPCAF